MTNVRRWLGVALLILGVIWSIGFPKSTTDPLRPDFVMSIAISVGLFGSAGMLLALRTRSWTVLALSIALLWSCLANVTLYAIARDYVRQIRQTDEISAQHHR
jgi:hypothetical protein